MKATYFIIFSSMGGTINNVVIQGATLNRIDGENVKLDVTLGVIDSENNTIPESNLSVIVNSLKIDTIITNSDGIGNFSANLALLEGESVSIQAQEIISGVRSKLKILIDNQELSQKTLQEKMELQRLQREEQERIRRHQEEECKARQQREEMDEEHRRLDNERRIKEEKSNKRRTAIEERRARKEKEEAQRRAENDRKEKEEKKAKKEQEREIEEKKLLLKKCNNAILFVKIENNQGGHQAFTGGDRLVVEIRELFFEGNRALISTESPESKIYGLNSENSEELQFIVSGAIYTTGTRNKKSMFFSKREYFHEVNREFQTYFSHSRALLDIRSSDYHKGSENTRDTSYFQIDKIVFPKLGLTINGKKCIFRDFDNFHLSEGQKDYLSPL